MPLLLFLYPWLELLSLIQLGIETNALFAIGWVILMIMLGSALLRRVGMASVTRLREAQQSGILHQHLLVDDMAVAVAAMLLIIPGLISDFVAVVVLIGPLRRWLARVLFGQSAATRPFSDEPRDHSRHGPRHLHRPVTLDGDYERVDDKPADRDRDV